MPIRCRLGLIKGITHGALAATALAALAAVPAPANALGFTGYYDPSNWTTTVSPLWSDASVDITNAPNEITITGPDIGQLNSFIDYTISADTTGTVNFSWLYSSADVRSFDGFGYLNGGSFTLLSDVLASGTTSFGVNAGDVFGFRVYSIDGGFGPGIATIADFSVSQTNLQSVPAPAAVLGVMAAFAWSRKLRRRTLRVRNAQQAPGASVEPS